MTTAYTTLKVDRESLIGKEPEFVEFFREFPEVTHFILYSSGNELMDVEFWFEDSSHPWGTQELIAGSPLRSAIEKLFPFEE